MRYETKLPAATSNSNGPTSQYVRRWRRLAFIRVFDHVTEASHRANPDSGVVELGAQPRDIHLDGVMGERVVPAAHRLKHVLLADDLPDTHEQVFERRPLARSEVERIRPDARAPPYRVDGEAAEMQLWALDRLAAAHERPHPRFQFRERERLGDVVVGPEIEAPHAVRLGVVGGEKQDASLVASAAQLTQHVESVDARKAEVEHDQVVVFLGASPQGKLPRSCMVHGVARLTERSYQPIGQRLVVLDDQNSHDKLSNRVELQDSTRRAPGFLRGVRELHGKKRAWERKRTPTLQRRKETTMGTLRGRPCKNLMAN